MRQTYKLYTQKAIKKLLVNFKEKLISVSSDVFVNLFITAHTCYKNSQAKGSYSFKIFFNTTLFTVFIFKIQISAD